MPVVMGIFQHVKMISSTCRCSRQSMRWRKNKFCFKIDICSSFLEAVSYETF